MMGKRSLKRAFNVQDNYSTPSILVNILIPYLLKWRDSFLVNNLREPIIWLPFDTEDSQYYKILKEQGFQVVRSHLNDDKDFFKWQPEQFDLIVSNPPFCYSDDTECLTKNGWKFLKELNLNDEIFSLNPETKELEWSKITELYQSYYSGDMYNFSSKTMDLFVTPNHRMYAEKWSYIQNKPVVAIDKTTKDLVTAKDIKTSMYQSRTGYKWNGKDTAYFVLPSTYVSNGHTDILKPEISIPMDNWLRFFGFWLADGYTRGTKNCFGKQRYSIGIKQSLQNKDLLISILEKLPFDYKVYIEKGTDKANFEIHSKQLWEYLAQFGKSQDKYIPNYMKDLNTEYLSLFFDSYMNGDSHTVKNGVVISTVSKQLSEDLQEIVLKLGKVIQFSPKKVQHKEKKYRDLYSSYVNNDMCKSNYRKPVIKKYDGFIYCPILKKNGVLLVRRNGKISFSGNSRKKEIMERIIFDFKKPFVLLMNMMAINYQEIGNLFQFVNPKIQFIIPDKKVSFDGNTSSFCSGYVCYDFIDHTDFIHLCHNNTKNNFSK